MLKIAVALKHRIEIVARFRHAMFERAHLMFDLLQVSESGERGFVNRRVRLEMNVLRQESELHATRPHHVARVKRKMVVLPAPFRPTSPTCSPALICKDAPRKTDCALYDL